MTAMLPHPLDIAIEYLTERSICTICERPVHSHDGQRGWVHTETGTYRCPASAGNSVGWIEPMLFGERERELEERYEDGWKAGQSECAEVTHDDIEYRAKEDGRKEGEADGYKEGRATMHNDLDVAIRETIDALGDSATTEELFEALDTAWKSIEV